MLGDGLVAFVTFNMYSYYLVYELLRQLLPLLYLLCIQCVMHTTIPGRAALNHRPYYFKYHSCSEANIFGQSNKLTGLDGHTA